MEDGTKVVVLTVLYDHRTTCNLVWLRNHLRELLQKDVVDFVGTFPFGVDGRLVLHLSVNQRYGIWCQILGVRIVLRLFFHFYTLPCVILSRCEQRHQHQQDD